MVALALAILAFAPNAARAGFITFTGTGTGSESGNTLSAEATFSSDGAGNLTVTLTNTQYLSSLVPSDVLSAVFFNVAGNPTLTTGTATLAPGSTVINPTYLPDGTYPSGSGNVGSEWSFAFNSNGLQDVNKDQNYGISSTGLSSFADNNRFDQSQPDAILDPPASPDGINYGIAGPGTTASNTTFNGGTGVPLIVNSVVFTFTGFTGDAATAITDVRFQYGTSPGESNFPGTPGGGTVVPEPSTMALAPSGVAGLGLAGLRRFRRRPVTVA